jgi:hypothetical protein
LTYTNFTQDLEYSTPLLDTWNVTLPGLCADVAHSIIVEERHLAHSDFDNPALQASEGVFKNPLPRTVTTVPPSSDAELGVSLTTDDS